MLYVHKWHQMYWKDADAGEKSGAQFQSFAIKAIFLGGKGNSLYHVKVLYFMCDLLTVQSSVDLCNNLLFLF